MYVIGIDEVGRGALAGPVVVGVVCIPKKLILRNKKLGQLRDSKKLSAAKREAWFDHFRTLPDVRYALARVYPRQIEKRNISQAANLAAHRALGRLITKNKRQKNEIYLDGGLFIKNREFSTALGATTIVKGDEKIRAIAVASIIAKVSRDRFMKKLSKKHPGYGLEIHKGYGTRMHRAALMKLGPSVIHRQTFLN